MTPEEIAEALNAINNDSGVDEAERRYRKAQGDRNAARRDLLHRATLTAGIELGHTLVVRSNVKTFGPEPPPRYLVVETYFDEVNAATYIGEPLPTPLSPIASARVSVRGIELRYYVNRFEPTRWSEDPRDRLRVVDLHTRWELA